jgi:hypothetical protein
VIRHRKKARSQKSTKTKASTKTPTNALRRDQQIGTYVSAIFVFVMIISIVPNAYFVYLLAVSPEKLLQGLPIDIVYLYIRLLLPVYLFELITRDGMQTPLIIHHIVALAYMGIIIDLEVTGRTATSIRIVSIFGWAAIVDPTHIALFGYRLLPIASALKLKLLKITLHVKPSVSIVTLAAVIFIYASSLEIIPVYEKFLLVIICLIFFSSHIYSVNVIMILLRKVEQLSLPATVDNDDVSGM